MTRNRELTRLVVSFGFFAFVVGNDISVVKKCVHLHYPDFQLTMNGKDCAICNQMFRIQFLELIPYSEANNEANKLIENIIESCCKECKNHSRKTKIINFLMNPEMLKYIFEKNDIVYPIFAYSNSVEVYGGYFIPFYDPSGAVYITGKEEFSLVKMILLCAKLWPLVLVGMSMVMVAGFIGWILELWRNPEEFPKSFVRGWWEGVWWSFVTMTTVGYGDKVPKSFPARLFTILWIYTGIVLCGILTASLTTIIMEGSGDKTPTLAGAKVGMLRNRIYDAKMIATNGGSIEPSVWCPKEELSVFILLHRLQDGEIDGFLLDKLTYWRWRTVLRTYSRKRNGTCGDVRCWVEELCPDARDGCDAFRECYPFRYKQCREGLLEYFSHKTTQLKIPHIGEEAAYGIWLKNRSHYDFFRNAFANNKMTFQSHLSSQFANQTKEESTSFTLKLYAEISHYYYLFLILSCKLVAIGLFGVCYEIIRKRKTSKHAPTERCYDQKLTKKCFV